MVAIGALGVTRLVHSALVSRAAGRPAFAVVTLLISATMLAGLFLPGGISSAASKFIPFFLGRGETAQAHAVYRLLARYGYLCSVALGVIVGLIMPLAYHVGWADAVATGVLTAIFSIYSVEKAALYGFDRIQAYVRLEITGSTLAIVSTVIIVAAGWHAYLLPLTLGYSVLIAGAWFLVRRSAPAEPHGIVEPSVRNEMAGYVGLASIGGLASAGLLQALPALAEIYTSRDEVVYFGTGIALVAPLYFLPRALSMALFPAMAHAHGAGDLDVVRRHADISTRALYVLLAPLFVFAIMLARPILALIFGVKLVAGASILQVLLLSTFVMVTQVAAVNALSSGSRRDVRIPVFSSVAGWCIGMVAAIPLGMMLGGVGIGVAYLLAAVVNAGGPMISVARRHKLAWQGPIGRAMAVLLGALVISLVVDGYSVKHADWWLIDIVVAVIAAALAAFVLYGDIKRVLRTRA